MLYAFVSVWKTTSRGYYQFIANPSVAGLAHASLSYSISIMYLMSAAHYLSLMIRRRLRFLHYFPHHRERHRV